MLEIKIKQKTYKKYADVLENNFFENTTLNEFHFNEMKKLADIQKVACLVSAGPSLNETVKWLKQHREKTYILCVGAALKVLVSNGIEPDAVIITDPKESTLAQVSEKKYNIPLYYLSTVYPGVLKSFSGIRCILLQRGLKYAESLAIDKEYPLLETGGSVATTAYSLLEFLGFTKVVLFGQDLGFKGVETHATISSSNMTLSSNTKLLQIKSNNNEYISTLPNLLSFKNWFERKICNGNVKVYNTALNGAMIKNVKYISEIEYERLF